MITKFFLAFILTTFFNLLWSCSGSDTPAPDEKLTKKRVIPVKVKNISGESFIEYGEFLGEIRGIRQAPLISHGGGRVFKVLGHEGQEVKEGDKLCDIEGESHEVKLSSAKLATKVAQTTYSRRKLAVKKGAVSRLQLDQAQGEVFQAKMANLEALKVRNGAFCVSPIEGTVVERIIREFQVIPPGSQTFVVADLSQMIVRFGIPENEIQGYQENSQVMVRLSAYPGRAWQGKIASLAQSVNERGRTFVAEAHISNEGRLLKPGLTARLKVERFSFKNQVVIPQSSILTSGKEQFVYVVENDLAKKRIVSILAGNKKHSVIKSGLKIGDKVIVAGHLLAGEGAPVKLIEAKPRKVQGAHP